MSDVIRRLQKAYGYAPDWDHCTVSRRMVGDAIAEIERLQAIIDRLDPPPGQCEHGVRDGDWCEPCNREYKRAAADAEVIETVLTSWMVGRCDDFDGEPTAKG